MTEPPNPYYAVGEAVKFPAGRVTWHGRVVSRTWKKPSGGALDWWYEVQGAGVKMEVQQGALHRDLAAAGPPEGADDGSTSHV